MSETKVTLDNDKVTNRIKYLKGIGVAQLEDFVPPGTQVCVRIDKELVHVSYRANYSINDKVYMSIVA